MEHPERVILFDGVCNLCNNSINHVIDHDPKGKFRFASLQSNYGKSRIEAFGGDSETLDSVLLVQRGKMYGKSRAALEIARQMSGLYPLLYAFVIVPPFIRNAVYNWIARNRYKWFGKEDSCRMPTPALKARFLDTAA